MYRLIILLFFFTLPLQAATQLEIADAYVAEAPPGLDVTAAYMTINNPTSADKYIVSLRSDDFDAVEMHTTDIEGGIAKMRKLDRLVIPANSSVSLTPGGIHLMLHKPKKRLHAGELITLEINEADHTLHGLVLPVKKMRPGTDTHHHHHHH